MNSVQQLTRAVCTMMGDDSSLDRIFIFIYDTSRDESYCSYFALRMTFENLIETNGLGYRFGHRCFFRFSFFFPFPSGKIYAPFRSAWQNLPSQASGTCRSLPQTMAHSLPKKITTGGKEPDNMVTA
jgi:hypothetical protein